MNHTRPASVEATHVRKNQCELSTKEWDTLVRAMKAMKTSKGAHNWDSFTKSHANNSIVHDHSTFQFMPWHRVFINSFETRLREFEPTVTLPYWDWSADRAIPKAFHAKIGGWMNVSRAVLHDPKKLPTKSDLDEAFAEDTYEEFEHHLEDVHDEVHVWVGGTMGSIPTAAADPLFYLHHAFLDKKWEDWQRINGYTHPNPDTVMQPSGKRIGDVLHLSALGATYH